MSADRRIPLEAAQPRQLELAVFLHGAVQTRLLPASGRWTIGRAAECDVPIDAASVSRQHAALHFSGDVLEIEDLGSANGTRVTSPTTTDGGTTSAHELRLASSERRRIAPYDTVSIGAAALVVRRAAPGSPGSSDALGVGDAPPLAGVVVGDAIMRDLHEMAARAASGRLSVLLLGETGVGKEVLAETIHARSPRAKGPFVRLNCAALAESLLESELFGHERGAFTGAVQPKPGLIEAAHGGTLFLDEIGELPSTTQVKLLRVLEDRKAQRVGAVKPRQIDVRFVAATNRDLSLEVARGAFRQDLYFRLNGISLVIPPLRERLGEIQALARAFVERACAEGGRARVPELSDEAARALRRHAWPGNLRELRNVMERALLFADGATIEARHLAFDPAPPVGAAALREDLAALERQRMAEALQQCAGNQTKAAELLGIPRRTFVTRLGEYGLPRPRRR